MRVLTLLPPVPLFFLTLFSIAVAAEVGTELAQGQIESQNYIGFDSIFHGQPKESKPGHNGSESFDAIGARSLFGLIERQTCSPGYGYCSSTSRC